MQSTTETYAVQDYSVKKISIHSGYNSANLQNDIAIIVLSGTVPVANSLNINTACFPTGLPTASTR